MKKETNLTLGISEPEKVEKFMSELNYPLHDVVKYLRKIILASDKNIGEGIYWNAPTFYYTGEMKPFNPKDYKRYITGFVFNQKDCLRLVFLRGAEVKDTTGLLTGDFNDGRRIASFTSLTDAKKKEKDLTKIIKELIKIIGK